MTLPWWAVPGLVLTVCAGVAGGILAAYRHDLTKRDFLLGVVALLVPFGWVLLVLRLRPVRAVARRLGWAAAVLGLLALWTVPALGAEMVASREVEVTGEDVAGLLARPVAEMERELADRGCTRFARAYWSGAAPLRTLRLEVRCKDGQDNERLSLR